MEELQSKAIEQLYRALLERASAEPFRFVAESVPSDWLDAFPADRLDEIGKFRATEKNAPVNALAPGRAVTLRSDKFGLRVLALAPVREPSLSTGLSREALIAMAHVKASLPEPDAHVDLYLVLIAPPGEDESEKWQSGRLPMESNDRICRVLVWLPPADPSIWPLAISDLIDRSFLALPFEAGTGSARDLDPLRRILQDIGREMSMALDATQLDKLEEALTSGHAGVDTAQALLAILKDGTHDSTE